jgi:hypothetical protein
MNIIDPIVVRRRIQQYINEHEGQVNVKLAGVITGHIEKYLKGVEKDANKIPVQRRLIYGYLLGSGDMPISELSTKALKDADVYALNKWLGSVNIEGEWILRPEWQYELYWVRARVLIIDNYIKTTQSISINDYDYLIFRDGYAMDGDAAIRGIDGSNELLKNGIMLGGDPFNLDKVSKMVVNPVADTKPAKTEVPIVYSGDISELM